MEMYIDDSFAGVMEMAVDYTCGYPMSMPIGLLVSLHAFCILSYTYLYIADDQHGSTLAFSSLTFEYRIEYGRTNEALLTPFHVGENRRNSNCSKSVSPNLCKYGCA